MTDYTNFWKFKPQITNPMINQSYLTIMRANLTTETSNQQLEHIDEIITHLTKLNYEIWLLKLPNDDNWSDKHTNYHDKHKLINYQARYSYLS